MSKVTLSSVGGEKQSDDCELCVTWPRITKQHSARGLEVALGKLPKNYNSGKTSEL
jgi:hypothetical protein